MSNEDPILKAMKEACDEIDEKEKTPIPAQADAIVRDIVGVLREDLSDGWQEHGEPDDPFVNIHYDVIIDGALFESARGTIAISESRNGALARYKRKYGNPEIGQEIKVDYNRDSGFWNINTQIKKGKK